MNTQNQDYIIDHVCPDGNWSDIVKEFQGDDLDYITRKLDDWFVIQEVDDNKDLALMIYTAIT